MSSPAASIPPSNMILLAALGIGAYWFATRTAQGATLGQSASRLWRQGGFPTATPIGPIAQTYERNDAAMWGSVGKILGTAIDKFSSSSTPNVYQQENAKYAGTGPVYDGSISGDPYGGSYSEAGDGFAANLAPGYSSIYDYSQAHWQ